MSIEIKSVKTGGFTANYFSFGSGKKTLVIIPGLSVKSVMTSAEAISGEYGVMKEEFTVYVFDRRNDVPERYTVKDMARDTALALNALGLDDICLFGASQGGMIALELAAEYPGLIKKAAVASTSVCTSGKASEVIDRWIEKARQRDGAGLYTDFGQAVYPQNVFERYKDLLAGTGRTVTDEEFRRFIILAKATKDYDSSLNEKNISIPLFAVGSDDDGVLGGKAIYRIVERFKNVPGFSYHIYSGFGHAAYDTAPDFKKRLYGFFR